MTDSSEFDFIRLFFCFFDFMD